MRIEGETKTARPWLLSGMASPFTLALSQKIAICINIHAVGTKKAMHPAILRQMHGLTSSEEFMANDDSMNQ